MKSGNPPQVKSLLSAGNPDGETDTLIYLLFLRFFGFFRIALILLEVVWTALDRHGNQFDFLNVVTNFLVNG